MPAPQELRLEHCLPRISYILAPHCIPLAPPYPHIAALLRACADIPVAELRALSLRTSTTVWSAGDWYSTGISTDTGIDIDTDEDNNDVRDNDNDSAPLFQELVSLTLVGIDFMRGSETALNALFRAMDWRQASPSCVTTLDRIELRACTIEEDEVDCLKEFASRSVGPKK
ncbi:hypothetical protein EDB87DRAFT_1692243 [Lactarius vividus]|nr:hypothetical protein EDB87DRAFT_1692243 [Lactarius vividus]